MPVDEAILRRYRKPEPRPPSRRWRTLLIVAVGGAALELGLFAAARESAGMTKLFVFLTVLLGLGVGLAFLKAGFDEDGILGALYTHRHPLGTVLGGDDPVPIERFILIALLALACLLSAVLLARNPDAVPKDWITPRQRSVQPGVYTR